MLNMMKNKCLIFASIFKLTKIKMKRILFIPLALLIILFHSCKENTVKSPSVINEEGNETYSKVNDLLSQMTLEEKVGQMTQINASIFVTDGEVDEAKLRKQIVERGLGSILNTPFNQAYSLEDWRTYIT